MTFLIFFNSILSSTWISVAAMYDFGTIPTEKEVRTNQKVGMKMALEPASAI
jgi:hypothetical protein